MRHTKDRSQQRLVSPSSLIIASAILLGAILPSAHAVDRTVDGVFITQVAVTGGVDTTNPGTTCVKISVPLPTACVAGWVAIQNNNKQLIAAAHLNKVTGNPVFFYYDEATTTPNFHCPARAFTQCSVVSIESKP